MSKFKMQNLVVLGAFICAMTRFAGAQTTVDLVSNGTQDGRVASSGGIGAFLNNSNDTSAGAIRMGDFEFLFFGDNFYRGILSFPTNQIPADATIQSASLFLTRGSTSGAITANFGDSLFEVQRGAFSNDPALTGGDATAVATAPAQTLTIGAANGSQTENPLNALSLLAVNQSGGVNGGITQVRVRWTNAGNNDGGSDYLNFYPGNATTTAFRPFLRVTYSTVALGLNVTPGNINFFDQDVNAGLSAAETVTIQNSSAVNVTITNIAITGLNSTDFSISDDTGEAVLTPGSSRTLGVQFDANDPVGDKSANLVITSDSILSPVVIVPMTGTATDRQVTLNENALDFGDQNIEDNETAAQQLVITNSGTSELTVLGVSIDPNSGDPIDFYFTNDTAEEFLGPGESRTIDIVFDPNFPVGAKSASVIVDTDAANDPSLIVALTGNGTTGSRRAFGDFDNSGCTDINDFLFLLDFWQTVSPIGEPEMNINDFLALLDFWQSGPTCPPTPTPSPTP